MGILDNVKGLEDIVSGMGEAEKPRQKPKKAEAVKSESPSNSRLEKIEDSVRILSDAVEDVRNSVLQAETQPSSEEMEKMQSDIATLRETVGNIGKGGGKSDNQDILRRLGEIDERIDKAVGEKIKSMEKMQNGEKRGFFGFKNDSEKRMDEAIKRMDKNLEIAGKRQEEIRAAVEERISEFSEMAKSSRKDDYSGDIELLKKSVAKIMADAKSAESRVSDIEIAENSRDGQTEAKDAIANEIKDSMRHSMAGFKSGIDRHIEDAAKKIDGISEAIIKKQDALERRINERLGEAAPRSDVDSAKKMAEKNSMDMKSRMDVLQKYVDGKLEMIGRTVEDRLKNSAAGGKEAELLKKHEGRISDMEKRQGEAQKIKDDMLESLKESLQHSVNGFKSGIDRHIEDAAKKMDDASIRVGKEQESIRRDVNEKLDAAIKRADERAGSRLEELSKRMDGTLAHASEMIRPLAEENKRINERLNEFSKKADSARNDASKMISDALKNVPKRDDIKKDIEERAGAMERGMEEKVNNKLNEINSGIERFWKDAEASKRQMSERLKEFASRSDLEKAMLEMKAAEERINGKEESIRKELNSFASKADIDRLNNAVNGRLGEFSKKMEFVSKFDLDKINSLANAERKIDENLKLFALNSDVEKVWKETESLKRYVDEKTKMADGLANSLRAWESRNMHIMEKEREFDEKLGAFPELKLFESRIRKTERALVELQRHFVAAQITEPIVME